MKVGDVHHSNRKTASFSTQDLIREYLDNLTSMGVPYVHGKGMK